MNKDFLAEALSKKLNISKRQGGDAINFVFDSIRDAMKKGEEVSISGFGSFRSSQRKARSGVNPRTGAKIQIPAMKVPKFRAGKGLKDAIK